MTALAPDIVDGSVLIARLLDLEMQLERERARNAGLERGIEALTAVVDELRADNARLRAETPLARPVPAAGGDDVDDAAGTEALAQARRDGHALT